MKLEGRNAIITGANQGLGLKIAETFIKEGASIAICARDEHKLEEAVTHLTAMKGPNQKIVSMKVDVSSEHDVQEFIKNAITSLGRIDIVVNNAGIYGPKGFIDTINSEDWKKTIEVNLFGTFYVCKHIIPHMKEHHYGKIINIAGGGSGALPGISAYVTSKSGVIRLTETLAEECIDFKIDINSIAPGALNTRLLDEVLEAGAEAVDKKFYEKALQQKSDGGVPLEKGAALCVFLASKDSDGITGKSLSAVWDSWNEFSKHIDTIKNTDVYTFRRITPQDRGEDWS